MDKKIFDDQKLIFISGPCSLESKEMAEEVASTLASLQQKYPEIIFILKSSYDKANRTSIKNFRGMGIEKGLEILAEIKSTYQLPILADIHLPEQAQPVAKVCDIIQIPAFLCRQTDLLTAAAKTGCTINVKKGQFLSPFDAQFIVEKLQSCNAKEIWLTERGTTFGYQNLIVDMRSFPIMQKTQCPVIFDATHSLQMPGKGTGTTGGDRSFAEPLARAALAAGAQGIFAETHPDPEKALSDSQTQLKLAQLPDFVHQCFETWKLTQHLVKGSKTILP